MKILASSRRWVVCLLLLVCAACATDAVAPGAAVAPVNLEGYRLGPGDQVRVAVYGQPTLSGTFQVNSAGSIAYPLVGDVPAQGKTTAELTATLGEVLRAGYVRQPNIIIEVAAYRPFFVLGEVGAPGSYPYTQGLTVMNAVAMSGGFTYRADIHRIYIKHPEETGERQYELTVTTPIMPGDTIRIPERRF